MTTPTPPEHIAETDLFNQGISDLFEGSMINDNTSSNPDLRELRTLLGLPTDKGATPGSVQGIPRRDTGGDLV